MYFASIVLCTTSSSCLVVLFVYLSVCVQDISKSCGWIQISFGGQVRCVPSMNRFDFGKDLDPDQDLKIFKVILHH